MSAPKENRAKISIDASIKKLAIIAGSGTVPRDLYQRCCEHNIDCVVVGFKGHTNYITPDFWGSISKVNTIINYLKKHDVSDMVFIGGVTRPHLFSLRPDWFTFKFFFKAWVKSFGDSSLLSAARTLLEKIGFRLHGAHKFLPELLMNEGVLGDVNLTNISNDDIAFGVKKALELGQQDIGQAVILKDNKIIAQEDKNGTNAMILNHGIEGAILVKMCKPQQDIDMDLPTIGPKTVQLCTDKKMLGIVGHAGYMLMAQQDEVLKRANDNGLFIYGQQHDV